MGVCSFGLGTGEGIGLCSSIITFGLNFTSFGDSGLGDGGGDGFLADLFLSGDVNISLVGFSFFNEFLRGEVVA